MRGKMRKSIPGSSGKELEALIAQYNKELMSYYHKNANRILPIQDKAPAVTPPADPVKIMNTVETVELPAVAPVVTETTAEPVTPDMDFPVPVIARPDPVIPTSVEAEEEDEIGDIFTAQDTEELANRLVMGGEPMEPDDMLPEEDGMTTDDHPSPPPEDNPENDTGYIQVRTFTARQAVPVVGATVTISKKNGDEEDLIRVMQTDSSGLSPVVPVPTVSRELSMQPGTLQPYTSYIIQSDADGFYSVRNLNVPVFGGITAVQPVEMVPLPEQMNSGMLEFPETGPQDLD